MFLGAKDPRESEITQIEALSLFDADNADTEKPMMTKKFDDSNRYNFGI